MKLYYAPGTCALACWIALEWAQADYHVQKVDYADPDFRKINPLGMVPALEIGRERAMTQADAILQYIVQKHPEADLGAKDGIDNVFEFNETMAFLTGDFHPAFWPIFNPGRYTTAQDQASLDHVLAAAEKRVDIAMNHLDQLIGDTGHVYQDKRTVADAYAFIMAQWSKKVSKTWKDYPHLAKFMETMKSDPAVQKVLAAAK